VTELSSRQIRLFLDAYALGDGSRHKRGGQVTYSTTSPGLADDLQELLLKAGSFANVRKVSVAGTVMRARGKEHRRKHDQYTLGERRERNGFWIVKRKHIRRQPYNGKVYCVSVPNQTIYVRRNGKPLWVSNCWRFGWNQTATILTTARASVKDILSGWLTGKQLTAHFGHQYGGSLSMLVPQQREGAPVIIPRDVVPHFWPYTVQAGPDGVGFGMVGGGRTWYSLGCVVAAAPMPRVAGKRCLELAQRIAYPNRGFRTDLRDSNLPTLPLARLRKLQTMGLLGGTV
jgi:hypothetical protein